MNQNVLKIAEILYSLSPDTQPWDGDPVGFEFSLNQNNFNANLAVKQATALLKEKLIDEGSLKDKNFNMWRIREKYS